MVAKVYKYRLFYETDKGLRADTLFKEKRLTKAGENSAVQVCNATAIAYQGRVKVEFSLPGDVNEVSEKDGYLDDHKDDNWLADNETA